MTQAIEAYKQAVLEQRVRDIEIVEYIVKQEQARPLSPAYARIMRRNGMSCMSYISYLNVKRRIYGAIFSPLYIRGN